MSRLTSAPIRIDTHAKVKEIGERNRLGVADTLDVLVIAWESLTPEQRREAIERDPAATEPDPQPAKSDAPDR